jgi:hypothetical protein
VDGLDGGAGPAMTARLEMFLQGGLGNQLIQLAYADSLQARTGVTVRINPVLLHPIWSRLRSISRRERCWNWASACPEVTGLLRQSLGLMRLYRSRFSTGPFTDSLCDGELLQHITAKRADAWYGLLGYFQRYQAFGTPAQRFWSQLKQKLLERYCLTPFPPGQLVVHIRLGDYLWPENQRLFARYPLSQQIREAQLWSRQLGGPETVHLVTDDPFNLERLLAQKHLGSFVIHRGLSAEDDFLFLARHRHIVGCNSTFSLCSGRLASELWGEPHVLRIPSRWYVDTDLDKQIQSELEDCTFVHRINRIEKP